MNNKDQKGLSKAVQNQCINSMIVMINYDAIITTDFTADIRKRRQY